MDSSSSIEYITKQLSSRTKLAILSLLSLLSSSNTEIFEKIRQDVGISYRSATFQALKELQLAQLIEKFYNTERGQIEYRLLLEKISFVFKNGKAELVLFNGQDE